MTIENHFRNRSIHFTKQHTMSNFASTNDIEGNDELKLEYFSDGETNGDEMKVIKQEDLENGNTASGNGEKVSFCVIGCK